MSRKKSAHEHWLSGDAGHRHKLTAKPPAQEAQAPAIVGGKPKCPPHLTSAERDQFRRISKLLGRRRVESEGDADVIAVAADPLDDISALLNVVFVMRDGRVFKHGRA